MLIEGPLLSARRVLADPDTPAHRALAAVAMPAMIGPNAILQALPVMERVLGPNETRRVLDEAQIVALPAGDAMIPEICALRLHHALSMRNPFEAIQVATESGHATADYIIAHRIPRAAAILLRWLPARLAAPLLMTAIRRHAWTFIGSGRFEPEGGWRFTIDRTDADDLTMPTDSLFEWYGAVFTRLYRRLVHPHAACVDEGCADARRFAHEYRIELRQAG
jgi:divinyl protochlorophyllide a 8-vinyl-reductase